MRFRILAFASHVFTITVIVLTYALLVVPQKSDIHRHIEWIVANTEFEYHGEPLPEVNYLPNEVLLALYFSPNNRASAGLNASDFGGIWALYDHGRNLLYLNEAYDFTTPENSSKLVHEFVHFMQRVNNFNEEGCVGNREKMAYELQAKWMLEHKIYGGIPRAAFIEQFTAKCVPS